MFNPDDYISILIESIGNDKAIPFDCYLYLKTNQKVVSVINKNDIPNAKFLDKLQNKNAYLGTLENKLANLQMKPPDVAGSAGARALTRAQLLKIKNAAMQHTNNDEQQAKDVGLQMIKEIRFGNLAKKSYQTGREMTVDFSVNAACKLLRENKAEIFESIIEPKQSQPTSLTFVIPENVWYYKNGNLIIKAEYFDYEKSSEPLSFKIPITTTLRYDLSLSLKNKESL